MLAFRSFSAISLLALLAQAPNAAAQAPGLQDLKILQDELAISTEKQQQLLNQATAALEAQESLSNRLVALASTAAAQEKALAKVEKRQSGLRDEVARINLELAARQDVIAEVLAGLQRLEHNPPPALIVAPDDVLGALRGALVFGAIVPELRNAAQHLHEQLAELKALRETLQQQGQEHSAALAALSASRSEILKLIEDKKALAQSSKADLEIEKLRAAALAEKATSLKQLLNGLAEEQARIDTKNSGEEKAKAEAQRLLDEKQVSPAMAFSQSQGQVNFPADGKILKVFGEATGLGGTSDGIVIATTKQAQVTSPVAGKVEFSGKFRSYGQLLIINAGEGYLIVLAGMEQTLAAHGQTVKAGEPIALMGEKPGKMALSNGLTNLTSPVLYVEIRHNGDPVDSAPWWIGNRQEAMR